MLLNRDHFTWLKRPLASSMWHQLRRFRDSVSKRDRVIFALAAQKLETPLDGLSPYEAALCVLHEATAETIPAGRTYLLGTEDGRPVVGSLISRIGVTERDGHIEILRLNPNCASTRMGPLR